MKISSQSIGETIEQEGDFDPRRLLQIGERVFCRVEFLQGNDKLSGEFFGIVKEFSPPWLSVDVIVTREDKPERYQYVSPYSIYKIIQLG